MNGQARLHLNPQTKKKKILLCRKTQENFSLKKDFSFSVFTSSCPRMDPIRNPNNKSLLTFARIVQVPFSRYPTFLQLSKNDIEALHWWVPMKCVRQTPRLIWGHVKYQKFIEILTTKLSIFNRLNCESSRGEFGRTTCEGETHFGISFLLDLRRHYWI